MKKITKTAKNAKIKILKSRLALLGWSLLFLLISSCIYLDGFTGPSSATAAENLLFTANVRIEVADPATDSRLIVSFLAPDSWDPRSTVSMSYTSDKKGEQGVVQTMSLIAQDVKPGGRNEANWELAMKNVYGVGPNKLTSMKWVTFQSDKTYTLNDNTEVIKAVVTIKAIAGPNNLKFIPGVFVNHSQDGLNGGNTDQKAVKYYDTPLEVTGGIGAVIDYTTSLGTNEYAKTVLGSPYPNPFYNEINIPLPGSIGDKTEVIMTDLSGKTIFQKEITNTSKNFNWSAEISNGTNLSKGVYLVTLKTKSSSQTFKIVKK